LLCPEAVSASQHPQRALGRTPCFAHRRPAAASNAAARRHRGRSPRLKVRRAPRCCAEASRNALCRAQELSAPPSSPKGPSAALLAPPTEGRRRCFDGRCSSPSGSILAPISPLSPPLLCRACCSLGWAARALWRLPGAADSPKPVVTQLSSRGPLRAPPVPRPPPPTSPPLKQRPQSCSMHVPCMP
jgi:hypothetical protein